jgi:hypothetical protein
MARKPKVATADAASDAPPEVIVTTLKGFDLNFQCHGFQFEIGKTYEHDGPVKICESGFHGIGGHPLELFRYYAPAESRYAETQQSGSLARHSEDSKVVSARITVSAEIQLGDLIQRAVKWVFDRAKPEGEGSHATGERGAASATGESGAASATGESGAASATGWSGAASATGWRGAASATGESGAASATGWRGAASATGWRGAASATGTRGAASATGERGAASATGESGRVQGADGCALFLVYRNSNDGKIRHAWAGIAGHDGIKPMVWYTLDADGKPQEVAS